MDTSFGSSVKVYKVTPGKKAGLINVECPNCEFKFVCSKSWLKGRKNTRKVLHTASCPNCFRTAWRRKEDRDEHNAGRGGTR